ncbi:MAG: hypothetical protein DPW16_15320 [Chloroflexi bacterium]|nr:hypothetical protein [Chloroflexota bacterium]
MQMLRVNPLTDLAWKNLVHSHDLGSVFHSIDWIESVSECYGFQPTAYILLNGSETPIAGLHLCNITDIRGHRLVSFPFCDFTDPIVADSKAWQALSDSVFADNVPFHIRCLHNEIPLDDPRLTITKQTMWHGLNVEPDLDTLWHNIDSSARRAIKKAQRLGVTVRPAETLSDWRAFFTLHLRIRKSKYQLLAQPFAFFEALKVRFVDKGRGALLLAELEGQVIGSVLYLGWKDTLTYKFSASDFDFLDKRPTDLLVWEGIRYAKENGYSFMDFGASDLDQEGLIRYKRKFADNEKLISFLKYTPTGYVDHPRDKETSSTLGHLTDLLTHPQVPDSVTENAGKLLYRYFV